METQKSVVDGILGMGGGGDEAAGLSKALFDSRKSMLKMITEITPDLVYPMALMTVIGDKYKSKTLQAFQKEIYQLQISRERKGRAELIEVLLAGRSSGESLDG